MSDENGKMFALGFTTGFSSGVLLVIGLRANKREDILMRMIEDQGLAQLASAVACNVMLKSFAAKSDPLAAGEKVIAEVIREIDEFLAESTT